MGECTHPDALQMHWLYMNGILGSFDFIYSISRKAYMFMIPRMSHLILEVEDNASGVFLYEALAFGDGGYIRGAGREISIIAAAVYAFHPDPLSKNYIFGIDP